MASFIARKRWPWARASGPVIRNRLAFALRNAPVRPDGKLERHRRPAFRHTHQMPERDGCGLCRAHALDDLDTGGSHLLDPASGRARIGIRNTDDDAGDPSGDNNSRTRRATPALVGAWLQGHVERAALRA
ncbi:MAG: hypothetical protein A49_16810 [Methyloceanibacter sp.]|nr:MAG: hypothetical protein A49_16810 [Methyloceanibacter sp.]